MHKGRVRRHYYPLLHSERKLEAAATKVQKDIFRFSRQSVQFMRLGSVLEDVVTPKGTTGVLSFLDTGSDTALVTDYFIRSLDVTKDKQSS